MSNFEPSETKNRYLNAFLQPDKRLTQSMIRRSLVIFIGALALLLAAYLMLDHRNPQTLFRQGMEAVQAEDWGTVKECRDLLSNQSDWAAHRHLLSGYLLESEGRFQLAFVVFSKANQHPETRTDAYFQAARIRYAQQGFSDAIAMLKQVIHWEPDYVQAHQLLAAACYDIGAMEQAIVSLDEVIRLEDQPTRAAYMKGSVLFDFERFADSHQAYQLALKHVGTDSELETQIREGAADALIRLRRFEDALQILKPNPPLIRTLVQRAEADFSLNRVESAFQQVETVLKQDSLHPKAATLMAQIQERQGDRKAGIQTLREALKHHPVNLPMHHRMADLLAADGQTPEALQFRSRAAEIAQLRSDYSHAQQDLIRDQLNPMLRMKVAHLAIQLQRFEEADAWYRAAIGMDPSNPEIQNAYSQFLEDHPDFQQQPEPAAQRSSVDAALSAEF